MNKSIKSAQGGFTLIELIVVIVILGILAATALPRFTNLSGDARLASLNAAKGALAATAAMTHGRHLLTPNAIQNVEGASVSMDMNSGYPAIVNAAGTQATDGLMQAAGLSTDYTVYTVGAATDKRPVVATGSIAIVPNSFKDSATAVKCYVTYTPATAVNTAPTIAVVGSVNDCQ
ncbi:type II secretion system protein [Massilia sp. IC2-278]|uniref:type II secretion system protein n=1 Tax=Massilia sp. IC2-278 TaxID=2887200 RepID=UPI0027D981A0|nr:type II secretion system protein [Massilia sp. IC2-278]